jgi:hypothetical protein
MRAMRKKRMRIMRKMTMLRFMLKVYVGGCVVCGKVVAWPGVVERGGF